MLGEGGQLSPNLAPEVLQGFAQAFKALGGFGVQTGRTGGQDFQTLGVFEEVRGNLRGADSRSPDCRSVRIASRTRSISARLAA